MYIPVLAIGRPTWIAPSTRSTRVKVDHTVVSVGPYIFQSSPHNGNRRLANAGASASPPISRRKPANTSCRLTSSNKLVNAGVVCNTVNGRSEEHTSELQSLMRISYAVFCLKKK